ncbi:MAG: Coq4 family protein [Phenylobacterium sp.]
MGGGEERTGFEALTAAGADNAAARALAVRLKEKVDAASLKSLAALWLHAAAASPERVVGVYDAAAEGWLGSPVGGPAVRLPETSPEPIPPAFWDGLWSLLEEAPAKLDAPNLTTRTAALAGLVSPNVQTRAARAAMAYPGVRTAAAQGVPRRFTLEALAQCPMGSLGGAFHSLIVDNGFDLEVLDREALGLDKLPPPLGYLNARILQCHDLWHILGGYQTTALHEVAISSFQLGQFGHHYSSMFLGMVLTRVAFERPEGGPLMLDTILSGWAHGRRTPPLLGVDWPAIWDLPTAEVRAKLGVQPYVSPWPADIFEQLSAAA